MSETFDLSVVLKIAAQGGARTEQEVLSLQDAIDDLRRTDESFTKTADELTRGLGRQEKALRGAALTTDEASKAEQRLLKVQRDRAKIEAGELNRQMDASIKARLQSVEAINSEVEATNRLAQAKNAERASAFSGSGVDNRLGTKSNAPKASDTGLAAQLRKEEADAIAKGTTEMQRSIVVRGQEEKSRQAELKSLRDAIQARYKEADAKEAAQAKQIAKDLENEANAGYKNVESLNSQRYALYEVAAAYGVVSTALIGLGTKTVTAFADMESGFTKVERTSGAAGSELSAIEDEILSLGRAIPTTTAEIQDLAARGAQMGIASKNIVGFAEVMAKFSATSPEVDVNTLAESFGRLSNLTGTDDYEALASSIAHVGVNAAATDDQIIKTTQEMARATAATTLTADEMIGLSAAFASLSVKPEAARGIMNQFFSQLDKGAAGLNNSMAVAAQAMNLTTDEATRLFKTDTGQFFQQFVEGTAGIEDMTLLLNAMGTEGARLSPTFKILAKDARESAAGQSVLAESMRFANEGFVTRNKLDEQYAPIADDLNSKFVLMSNAVKELAYTVGTELAPTLKGVMDAIIGATQAASDFVNNPIGGFVVRMAVGLATVVTAYSALRAAIALSTAMLYAFSTAAGTAAATGLLGSLKGLVTALGNTSSAAWGAATATGKLRIALLGLGRATIIGAALQYVAEWIFNTGDAAITTGGVLYEFGNFLVDIAKKINGFVGFDLFKDTTVLQSWGKGMQEWGQGIKRNEEATSDLGKEWGAIPPILEEVEENAGGVEDGFDGAADAAKDVVAEVRTLLDYANDLSSVWDRAFEIRFASGQAEDKIAKTFNDLEKAAEESAQKMRDLRQEIRGLKADIGVLKADIGTQQYFLSIALEYGDDKRAAEIQADIVDLQSDLSEKQGDLKKTQKELTKEQDANSKALTGNSDQAIKNRETILGLVETYEDQIDALARSGLSSEELAIKTEELRQDFIDQATQLGFNRGELRKYEGAFDDVRLAIKKVPRNITIKANADPALQAFAEFKAKADTASKALSNLRNNVGKGVGSMPSIDTFGARQQAMQARLNAAIALLEKYRKAKDWGNMRDQDNFVENLRRQLANGNFYTGGFTGQGGKYEPAGIVHRGEYVVPKHQVNQRTGLPYADAMGKLTKGSQARTSYAGGGFVGGSGLSGPMDLSAHTIQQLARVVKSTIILDGSIVGTAASNSYAANTRVGAA